MAEYPGAIDAFVDQSRVFIGQNTHSALVLHGTGGSPDQTVQQLGAYFATTPAMTSVHYGVDRAGNVAQYVLESDGAAGNCCVESGYDMFWDQFNGDNLNVHTLSIEHVNDSTNSLPLTDAQKQASFRLIAYLCEKYNISFSHIKGHASIAPQTRASCPGPAFPWTELQAYLQNGDSMIPTSWHDDGTTLTAPNGITVVRGFREYILENGWDANNLPLQAEQPRNPLELSNPSLGAGTQQIFRWTVLEWTSDRGVFVAWVGQELLAYRKALQDAQAQIATLQQNETSLLLQRIADDTKRFNQIGSLLSEAAQLTKVAQA